MVSPVSIARFSGFRPCWLVGLGRRWLLLCALSMLAACGGDDLTPRMAEVEVPTGAIWGVDGEVFAVAPSADGSVVYLAGNFTTAGPLYGGFVGLRRDTARLAAVPPDIVQGVVYASVPDGQGGWYIGGDFSSVGATKRNHIARIRADGKVDPDFDSDASAPVWALAVAAGAVYVAGDFTRIGGQARGWLGAVDAVTGQATPWKPSPNYRVYALAVGGNSLYVGGEFTEFAGREQRRIGAFDLASGAARDWSPGPAFGEFTGDGTVKVIVAVGDLVYVGGDFGMMGGQPRPGLAAVDSTTGLATRWHPSIEGAVTHLAVGADAVYASGPLKVTVNGQQRIAYAAFDRDSGATLAWDPNVDAGEGGPILLAGDTVYVAGALGGSRDFSRIGGQDRRSLAALDARTGLATAWSPVISSGQVATLGLAADGSTLLVGGKLHSVDGVARRNVAAISMVTGAATAWDPQADYPVYALAVTPDGVLLGGGFSKAGGQSRYRLALVDNDQGKALDWQAYADGDVLSVAVAGQTVYVGGRFTQISGQSRNRLGAVALADGRVTPWRPEVRFAVSHIVASEDLVYITAQDDYPPDATAGRQALTMAIEPGGEGRLRWSNVESGLTAGLALVDRKAWFGFRGTVGFGIESRPFLGLISRDADSGALLSASYTDGPLARTMAAGADNTLLLASDGALTSFDTATGKVSRQWTVSGGLRRPFAGGLGRIHALATRGGVVYAVGDFTGIGDSFRSNFDVFSP